MKALSICAGLLMLLALFRLPIGYYTFLRIATTLICLILIADGYIKINFWIIGLGVTAIIFNPVWPVYLHDRARWLPINVAAAILFFAYSFQSTQSKPN